MDIFCKSDSKRVSWAIPSSHVHLFRFWFSHSSDPSGWLTGSNRSLSSLEVSISNECFPVIRFLTHWSLLCFLTILFFSICIQNDAQIGNAKVFAGCFRLFRYCYFLLFNHFSFHWNFQDMEAISHRLASV